MRDCDRDRRYYAEGYAKLAASGYLGLLIPEKHGGSGGTTLAYALLCEAMGKYGVDFAIAACVSTFSAMNLIHYGTDEQIDLFIPRYLDGSVCFCVAISEPEAGSDAAATATRAVRDGDHYVLTGLKQWCSGSSAPGAHLFTLVRTDPAAEKHAGLSVLLLANDLPGLELRKLNTLARRGTGTNQIFLDGTMAPLDSLIGAEGQGWEIITRHLLLERIAIAAAYVGCAQQAVDDACQYALERKQFGQPLFEFQALNHMLADMQTKVDAARLLVYRAAPRRTPDRWPPARLRWPSCSRPRRCRASAGTAFRSWAGPGCCPRPTWSATSARACRRRSAAAPRRSSATSSPGRWAADSGRRRPRPGGRVPGWLASAGRPGSPSTRSATMDFWIWAVPP